MRRVTSHGPSEVTVEEVRIVNHFPAVNRGPRNPPKLEAVEPIR